MTSWLDDGLAGARVLVTGARGGIGAAVAGAFVSAGSAVVATDIEQPQVPEARLGIAADLRGRGAPERVAAEAAEELGGLDVVAHMAGVLRRRERIADVTEADWDLQHEVNLKASFFLLRAAAERMVAQGTGGRLVAATSQGWWSGGYGGSAVYAASKGGLVSLCRGLARSYGPAGITVNTVAPGVIDNRLHKVHTAPEVFASLVKGIPIGRAGSNEDVAGAVAFLASPNASYITGEVIHVNGGLYFGQ